MPGDAATVDVLALLTAPGLAERIQARLSDGGPPIEEMRRRIRVSTASVAYYRKLLDKVIGPSREGLRVLEVGAGMGIFVHSLAREGWDIIGVEPFGQGFEWTRIAHDEIRSVLGIERSHVLDIGIEELDPDRIGLFDLIVSFHVLEHVPDLDNGWTAMRRCLKPGGRMLHLAPNYAFPYDPHIKRFLVPFAPRLTNSLLGESTRANPIWQSVNFVTFGRLKHLASASGLRVARTENGLVSSLDRSIGEKSFSDRHRSPVARLAKALFRIPGTRALLDLIPHRLVSPMIVEFAEVDSPRHPPA